MPVMPPAPWTVKDLDRFPFGFGLQWELIDGMVIGTAHDRKWTVADLDRLPDIGAQYELADGAVLVTPSPSYLHQRAVFRLAVLLRPAPGPGMETFIAPLDWCPDELNSLRPDVLVIRRDRLGDGVLTGAPTVVAEVLSPSTRRKDQSRKFPIYESGGIQHYWIVDPDEPSIVAYELRDGRYVEVGRAAGSETLRLSTPFEIEIVPTALVEP